MKSINERLMEFFNAMLAAFGPQNWWPGDSPLEIMIGAVLTQNTNWKNVERAIDNLRREKMINIEKIVMAQPKLLAELIRPAGYFTVKAKRLKNLMNHIWKNFRGDLDQFFDLPVSTLREELLSISGIGPETADDIILYAANKPTFVVDTYTYRILLRHHLISQDDEYMTIKELFEDNLPADVDLFNEYHALIVAVGKNYCKKTNPTCENCPLNCFDHDPNLPEYF
jgi:endonuclease-3 related protein